MFSKKHSYSFFYIGGKELVKTRRGGNSFYSVYPLKLSSTKIRRNKILIPSRLDLM